MSAISKKILYLDESGDHSLELIDPQYPVFVLGGVILDSEYVDSQLDEALNAFKKDIFGQTDIIIHTSDITRNRNGFECMKDLSFRSEFYSRLNNLMRELDYQVIACAIRKDDHASRYGMGAIDPYMLALHVLSDDMFWESRKKKTFALSKTNSEETKKETTAATGWLFCQNKKTGTRYAVPSHCK